ncbi:site-specific integrase [Bernardetia sp. Wsw4-3y2]|uniref:tyrosine-type recombinase/integrase n=1 Tax=Bernardetia sp. Wsw4-3y2 TaxID=3127471 RepID=UPI0030CEE7D7
MDKNEKYPYKAAQFVNAKKPYIDFGAWDIDKQKIVRKRIYKNASEDLAKQINTDLENGLRILTSNDKLLIEKEKKRRSETAINAFELAFNNAKPRLRKRSISSYRSHKKYFCLFLYQNYKELNIRSLQQIHVKEFLNDLQRTKKVSNITRNAYASTISILLSELKELGYIDSNVMENFKKLKVQKTMAHKFYNSDQKKIIKDIISKENPNLWLVCQIIFYTFVRPQEIRFLKVGYIEKETNKLYIPAEISKNGKSERVDIPNYLMHAFIESGFLSYHSDCYLFGIDGIPSNKSTKEGQFTKEYKIIKDRLKLSDKYTLYSWKHTGAIAAYKNGVDILEISQQCRHHDLDQTRTYLRGLGVYSSEKIKNNFPEL